MNSLTIFFGVLMVSFFGLAAVFIAKRFRENHEKILKVKLAIQNSEKEKIEEEVLEVERENIGKKKKKQKIKIIEERKVEIQKNVSTKDLSALLAKSDFHIMRKNFVDAEKILIEVLSFDNNHSAALEKLGHIYIEIENYAKAKLLYENLIENFPRNPNVYTNYGMALLYEKEFEASIAAYQRAQELDPDNAERDVNLGKLFFTLQNFPSAIEFFVKALKKDPRNLTYHFLIADTYKTNKQLTESKIWYEKILELSPYNSDAKKEIEKFEALGF